MMLSTTRRGGKQDTASSKRRLDLITGRPDGFTSTSSSSDTPSFQGKPTMDSTTQLNWT
jgi:hypothetical protein